MKLKECIYFVYMDIITKFKYYFISLVLLTVTMFVINAGLGTYYSEYYKYNILKKSFDTDEVYKVEFPYITINEEYASEIIDFIKLSDEMGLSMYSYSGITFKEKNAGYVYDGVEYDSTNVLFIDNIMLENSKLSDEEGKKIELKKDGEYYEAAVGYDLKEEFPVGTVVTDDKSGRKYKVTYILEKDLAWLATDPLEEFDIEQNLDEYFIIPIDDYYFSGGYAINIFSYTNSMYVYGDDISSKIRILYENAEECGITIEVKSLDKFIDEDKEEYKELYVLIIILCILLGCASVVIIIMLSVLDCVSDKHSIGVYMANGMLSTDIFKVILIKNMSRIIIPFIICTCTIFISYTTEIDLYSQLIMTLIILIAAIMSELTATGITYGIIKKSSVLNMIRGED